MEGVEVEKPSVPHLERDVKLFIEELRSGSVDVTNFRDWGKEVEGIMTSLNTALGGSIEEMKKARESYATSLNALKRVMKEDIYSVEPLGKELKECEIYLEKVRTVASIQQLIISVLVEYVKKLETALSSVEGVKLSNEFLERVERFTNMMIEKGIENQTKIFKESLEKVVKELEEERKSNERLMESIEKEIKARDKLLERVLDKEEAMINFLTRWGSAIGKGKEEIKELLKKLKGEAAVEEEKEEESDELTEEEKAKLESLATVREKAEALRSMRPHWDVDRIHAELERLGYPVAKDHLLMWV